MTAAVITLTVPPELRLRVAHLDVLADLRRAAWATATGWLLLRPGVVADVRWIGRVAVHPEGRESPGKWSPHVDVLAAGVIESADGTWAPVRLPGLVEDGELMAAWADALGRVVGRPVAYARVEAAPERRGRRAATRYCLRAWPGWITPAVRVVSYGRLPRAEAPLVYGETFQPGGGGDQVDLSGDEIDGDEVDDVINGGEIDTIDTDEFDSDQTIAIYKIDFIAASEFSVGTPNRLWS